MPTAEIRGTDLYYEILGAGEPVVLLNGILMTVQSWALQTAVLRQRYRCVVHDFRGQLLSGKPEEAWTLDTHVADLAALLDHLEISSAHLVGTSYGGEVAMIFALEHPDRVRSMAVIASASHVGPRLSSAVEQWAEVARERPRSLYRAIVPWTFSNAFLEANPDFLALGEERLGQAGADFFPAFARLVDAFLGLDVTARLPGVACPTLVLCGEQDALKPPRYSRRIAAAIPEAELLLVPEAGHAVVIEKPDAVNTAVIGLIERCRRRGSGPR